MLLASVGQAATYTSNLHAGHTASSSGTKKVQSNVGTSALGSTSTANSFANGNNHNNTQRGPQAYPTRSLLVATNKNNNSKFNRPTTAVSATHAATTLMKTLSVRLHRGTEYIKDTVQRALVVSAAAGCSASSASSVHSSSRSSSNTTKTYGTTQPENEQEDETELSSCSVQQHQERTPVKTAPVPTASFLKLYTVPPTALHRSTQARQHATGSTDSLLKELCHFKPIRPMPLTRMTGSKSYGCDIKNPTTMHATKRTAVYAESPDSDDDLEESAVLKPKPNTTFITNPQKSAFVCLIGCVDIKVRNTPTKPKAKRRRRRLNTFGVPRRRVRRPAPVPNVGNNTTKSESKTPQNPDATPTANQRKRKHQLEPPMPKTSNKSTPTPEKVHKRQRKGKTNKDEEDYQVDNTPSPPKRTSGKRVAKAVARSKASAANLLRHSPPMTRQRAREISAKLLM